MEYFYLNVESCFSNHATNNIQNINLQLVRKKIPTKQYTNLIKNLRIIEEKKAISVNVNDGLFQLGSALFKYFY